MKTRLVPQILVLMLTAACASSRPAPVPPVSAGADATPAARLAAIAGEYWEERLRASPTWATNLGDRRRDAELPDVTDAGERRHLDAVRAFRARLETVDRAALSPRDRITAEILDRELASTIEETVCRDRLWSVDALYGPQVYFAQLPNFHTVREEKHARDLIARYRAMKPWYEAHVANLRRGLREGRVAARIPVEKTLAQLEQQLAAEVGDSPYLAVALPETWSAPEREAIGRELRSAVEESVRPGLALYRDFLRDELLPKARMKVGVSAIPDGPACYEARIRIHTGLERTAEEIHALGLREVERIGGEMRALIKRGRGGEDVQAWLGWLRERPEQYRTSPEELLEHNRRLVARAQQVLPKAFGRLPKTPIEVKALEAFRAKDAPAGYYYEAPGDGSRPALYYVNTHDPASRPLYNMAALAFHEAVPGHHLQIALANENEELPEFQRRLGQSAFVEGWALYAETLADELGLYASTEEKMGALNYEMWRAVRLVVDTGMHAKGWSRAEALRYFLTHTAHTETEAVAEIDRYITWPGQALAYKIGQLEIRAIRTDAEKALGDRFDLKAFHDRLLSNGAVPLPTARRDIEAWISEQLTAGEAGNPSPPR